MSDVQKNFIRYALSLIILTLPLRLRAHEECYGAVKQSAPLTIASLENPANIKIDGPKEGEVIRSRTFNLLYTLAGDLNGDNVDHIHWQINSGPAPTAPDLSGVDVVTVENDGHYTLTVWLADAQHFVINGKKTVSFIVETNGIVLIAPSNSEQLHTCDVIAQYSLYGDLPEAFNHVSYRVDGGDVQNENDADGKIPLVLGIGAHNIQIWMSDSSGNQLGDASLRSFIISTDLTPGNASEALKAINKAAKAKNLASWRKSFQSVKSILTKMKSGGSRNPDHGALTSSNVIKALSLQRKLNTRIDKSDNFKKLLRLLKTMAAS